MPMVKAQFRPLGLGNTQTADPASVVGCKPHEMSRWFRNTETAGFPRNARYLGLYLAILRSKTGRAAMKSARRRCVALTVGRATADVSPHPYSSKRGASSGSNCRVVKPAR